MVGFTDSAIMEAKLNYAFIAAFQAAYVGLMVFRYRSQDWSAGSGSYYDDWSAAGLGFDVWKYANWGLQYSKLAIFGAATLTSLLDLFGVDNELNWMVWSFGVGMGAMVIDLMYLIAMTYAYDKATNDCRQNADASGCLVQNDIRYEMSLFFGTQAFAAATLLKNSDAFLYSNKKYIDM